MKNLTNPITTSIAEFLHYLTVEKGFSPQTLKAYDYDLRKFVDYLDTQTINTTKQVAKEDIRQFMTLLASTGVKSPNSAVTRARKLSSIKSFFKYLSREGFIDVSPATDIESPKIPYKEPSYLTHNEYIHLLQTIRKVATPYYLARDLAIVVTLLGTGIRLSELVGLTLQAVDLKDKHIKVKGKGNKERVIPLNDTVVAALKRYLLVRPEIDCPYLFISRRSNRLSAGSVYHLIKTYLKASKIDKDKIAVHSLRHSFGASLLNQGVNLVVIQELLGHKKLETTRRYLHINNVDLRKAVEQIVFS